MYLFYYYLRSFVFQVHLLLFGSVYRSTLWLFRLLDCAIQILHTYISLPSRFCNRAIYCRERLAPSRRVIRQHTRHLYLGFQHSSTSWWRHSGPFCLTAECRRPCRCLDARCPSEHVQMCWCCRQAETRCNTTQHSLPPSVPASQSLRTFRKRSKPDLFQESYTTSSLLWLRLSLL